MKIVTKAQMLKIMDEYPHGGVVFAETRADWANPDPEIMVTDGRINGTGDHFGATIVVPHDGEVYDFDWNIAEYKETDIFAVYDHEDILQMIQTLTRGLKTNLKPGWYIEDFDAECEVSYAEK